MSDKNPQMLLGFISTVLMSCFINIFICVYFLRLYSVGGRDGSSCLSSMEYYDPHTNKWNMCAPMCKRRGGVGVATCDGFLYAVGGHDAPASNHCSRLLDYVERYPIIHAFYEYKIMSSSIIFLPK